MPLSTKAAVSAVKNADNVSCFEMAKILVPGQLSKSSIAPGLIQGYQESSKSGGIFYDDEEELKNRSKVYKSGKLDNDIGVLVKPSSEVQQPLLVQLGKPLGSFYPPAHGPFSALTPSMWPQDILSILTQSEKYRLVNNSSITLLNILGNIYCYSNVHSVYACVWNIGCTNSNQRSLCSDSILESSVEPVCCFQELWNISLHPCSF